MQRRNGMEDLFGVMFSVKSDTNNNAQFYISISPDMVYLQRFAFKLHIRNTESTNWQMFVGSVDVTDYLIEQHDDEWIEGEGIYPNNEIEYDEDDDEGYADYIEDFYDILDVVSMKIAENTEDSLKDAKRLLRPGFKKIVMKSDAPFEMDAYLYLKYSHTNR